MIQLSKDILERTYPNYYQSQIKGRRITLKDIEPLLLNLGEKFSLHKIGASENGQTIYKVGVGSGQTRIFSWSQMHGNESTGTKALFDLFNFFENPGELSELHNHVINSCTMEFIVLLNPDGAEAFTRSNANGVDLNRDAVDRSAIESQLLRKHLDDFSPRFCFNLHDQRSIFNVEGTSNPATLSFLAPSEEEKRKVTFGRKETMKVISEMNLLLQTVIPGHIGRYTDEFYPTATGDNFQKLGYNTILIEAGHTVDDYDRERTRKYNFYALLQGILSISQFNGVDEYEKYFDIPNNDKKYLDIIYRNICAPKGDGYQITDIGVQIKYKVENDELVPFQTIEKTGELSCFHSNTIIYAENLDYNELKLSNS